MGVCVCVSVCVSEEGDRNKKRDVRRPDHLT